MNEVLRYIKDNNNRQRGMTFLELLITAFILTVGISGSLGLIHNTIYSASIAASQLKAAYLAQEGIEVVRNVRDSNWVRDDNWLNNIPECLCCEVAYNHGGNEPIQSCPGGEPRLLKYYNGFYAYSGDSGAVDTIFRRRIKIAMENTGTENERLRVEATVSWEERGTVRGVTVVENLYNWR